MSEKETPEEGALEVEQKEPIVADYTDSQDREEAHEQQREGKAATPEKPAKKEKGQKPEPGYVPLREVLDTRDRAKAAEAERDRYRQAYEAQQRKLQAEQDNDPPPDQFKDPKAYNAWIERQLDRRAKAIAQEHVGPLQQQLQDQTLRLSETSAKAALGDKKWGALNTWITAQDDNFRRWAMAQPDPYHAAWQEYRRATTFDRLGADDLETYEEKRKAEWLKEYLASQGAAPVVDDEEGELAPQTKPLPASFAAKPSIGERKAAPAGPRPLGAILADKPTRQQKQRR